MTYLSGYILLGIVEQNRLWYFKGRNGQIEETPYIYIFQYLVFTAVPILALFMFTAFVGLVVYGFLGYHLYLICRGTTTNETFKWSSVNDERKQFLALQAKKRRTTSIPIEEFEDESKAPFVQGKPLVNIYNRGILMNFYEVFFPLSPHTKHPASSFPSKPTQMAQKQGQHTQKSADSRKRK